jgi:hypothetical protein
MKVRKTLFATALGSILLVGAAGYAAAAPQEGFERGERGPERQEQIARSEIRRGEALEQQGHQLERQGQWRRGEMLERQGENLERHGQQMLREAERHENFGERGEGREDRR